MRSFGDANACHSFRFYISVKRKFRGISPITSQLKFRTPTSPHNSGKFCLHEKKPVRRKCANCHGQNRLLNVTQLVILFSLSGQRVVVQSKRTDLWMCWTGLPIHIIGPNLIEPNSLILNFEKKKKILNEKGNSKSFNVRSLLYKYMNRCSPIHKICTPWCSFIHKS